VNRIIENLRKILKKVRKKLAKIHVSFSRGKILKEDDVRVVNKRLNFIYFLALLFLFLV